MDEAMDGSIRGTGPGAAAHALGWYGKLPCVGDFVGQGLPWQRRWDEWLQRAMRSAESAFGPVSLRQRVRGMAAWQMLLPAATGQDLGWCAIVAGSTDRVGRVFPLVIAEGLPQAELDTVPLSRLQARMLSLSDWLWETAFCETQEQFAQDAAAWVAGAWPLTGGTDAAVTVAGLRRSRPGAGSYWWPTEPVPDPEAALAESWPPPDDLLLRVLQTEALPG